MSEIKRGGNQRQKPFAMLDVATLRRKNMSYAGKGLYAELATHNYDKFTIQLDNQQIRVTRPDSKTPDKIIVLAGRDKVQTIVNELRLFGHLRLCKSQNADGTFSGSYYEFYEFADDNPDYDPDANPLPIAVYKDGQPRNGKPDSRQPRQTANPTDGNGGSHISSINPQDISTSKDILKPQENAGAGAGDTPQAPDAQDGVFENKTNENDVQDKTVEQLARVIMSAYLGHRERYRQEQWGLPSTTPRNFYETNLQPLQEWLTKYPLLSWEMLKDHIVMTVSKTWYQNNQAYPSLDKTLQNAVPWLLQRDVPLSGNGVGNTDTADEYISPIPDAPRQPFEDWTPPAYLQEGQPESIGGNQDGSQLDNQDDPVYTPTNEPKLDSETKKQSLDILAQNRPNFSNPNS